MKIRLVRPICHLFYTAGFAIAILTANASIAAEVDATWIGFGTTPNWGDGTNWSTNPSFPNNTAETTYDVTIQFEGSRSFIPLDRDIEIDRLFIGLSPGGTVLEGPGSLVVNKSLAMNEVSFETGGFIESRGDGYMSAGYLHFGTTRFVNAGHLIVDAGVQLMTGSSGANGTLINESTGTIEFRQGLFMGQQASFNPQPIENRGTWIHQAESTWVELPFQNDGRLIVESGLLTLARGSTTGSIEVAAGATVSMRNYFSIGDDAHYSGNGTIEIRELYQPPASIGANFQFNGLTRIMTSIPVDGPARLGSRLEVTNTLTIRSHATAGEVVLDRGAVRIEAGGSLTAQSVTSGGIVLNDGTIIAAQGIGGRNGSVLGNGSVIAETKLAGERDFFGRIISHVSPGLPTGSLEGLGRLEFSDGLELDNVSLDITLGGTARGLEYDAIDVGATLTSLKSTLSLSVLGSFSNQITATDEFEIIRAQGGIIGSISNALEGSRVTTINGLGSFLVGYRANPTGGTSIILGDYQPVPELGPSMLIGFGLFVIGWRPPSRKRSELN